MTVSTELDFDRLRARSLEVIIGNATDMPAEEPAASRVRPEKMREPAVRNLAHETAAVLKNALRTVASLWGGPRRALPDSIASGRMDRSAQT